MTLLQEIEAYLKRNDINPTNFGIWVMGDGGFLVRVRKIGEDRVRQRSKDKARKFMADNPDGGALPRRGDRKKCKERRQVVKANKLRRRNQQYSFPAKSCGLSRVPGPIDISRAIIVDRDPCFMCGTRRDLGCEHYPLEAIAA